MRRLGLAALCLLPAVGMAGASALWLNLPLSVGQAGFGNVSLGGGDILRAWSNPAALGDLATPGEVTVNGGSLLGGNQTTLGFGGAWRLSERWTAGALMMSTSDSFGETDATGSEVGGSVGRRVSSAGVGAGWQAGRLQTGILLRGVSDDLAGDSASAVAADIGAAYAFDAVIVAVAARNIGTPLRGSPGAGVDAESLPSEVRGGVAFRAWSWHMLVAAEGRRETGGPADVGAGVEWWPMPAFGVRAGLPALASGAGGVTAGLSVNVARMRVDYAAATHALGLTHRMSLAWSLGSAPGLAAVGPAPEQAKPVAEPAVPAVPRAKLNMAVGELQAEGVSGSNAAMLTALLRNEIVGTGAFRVVERVEMDRIMGEQMFQRYGCTTNECAVKLGKLLNVQRMVMGTLGKLFGAYLVTVRVVDVETGQVVFSQVANGKDEVEMMEQLKALAQAMARQVR